jgi:hypothetical protein
MYIGVHVYYVDNPGYTCTKTRLGHFGCGNPVDLELLGNPLERSISCFPGRVKSALFSGGGLVHEHDPMIGGKASEVGRTSVTIFRDSFRSYAYNATHLGLVQYVVVYMPFISC